MRQLQYEEDEGKTRTRSRTELAPGHVRAYTEEVLTHPHPPVPDHHPGGSTGWRVDVVDAGIDVSLAGVPKA
jgi:hypothetical protein